MVATPEPIIVALAVVNFLTSGLAILATFLIFLALFVLFKIFSTPSEILSSNLYLAAASSNYLVLYLTIASIVSYLISFLSLLSTLEVNLS